MNKTVPSANLQGMQFGRWTVLDTRIKTEKGEIKWLCRCECGTERFVLARSLVNNGSLSCGCVRKENAAEAVSHDVTGMVFGDLTVIEESKTKHKNGGRWWVCRCACGNLYETPATLLVKGRRTHCGCKTNRGRPRDITGRRFGRLTAIAITDQRSRHGDAIWKCQCDCGNEAFVSYNELMYSSVGSCGCQRIECNQLLGTKQTRVDGTSLDIIRSTKLPTSNTTGVKGVYLIKGKYVPRLCFQKKAYWLGRYDTLEEAHQVRLEAEEAVFGATLEYYEKWNACAQQDSEWAEQNPVTITVIRDGERLHTEFLPVL